jgi:hypothetical protein
LKLVGTVALPAFSEAARAGDHERLKALYYRFRLLVDLPCCSPVACSSPPAHC